MKMQGLHCAIAVSCLIALSQTPAYSQSGHSSPSARQSGCISVASPADVSRLRRNLSGSFCLTADIDLISIPNFAPIGDATTPFTGTLDGQGHIIRNLVIKRHLSDVGFFGVLRGTVKNLQLLDVSVTGEALTCGDAVNTGSLAGSSTSGTFLNSSVTGRVGVISKSPSECATAANIGGLVGRSTGGSLDGSWSRASVTTAAASVTAGGLVGWTEQSLISNVHASGEVRAGHRSASYTAAGGLIGLVNGGTISAAYATGNVTLLGTGDEGGLLGYTTGALDISDSYATGNVGGSGEVREAGGLIGISNAHITRTFATGSVNGSGARAAGGLVGHYGGFTVSQSFALGDVSGVSSTVPCNVGGLFGQFDSGAVSEVYSLGQVSYRCDANGGPIERGGLVGMLSDGATAESAFWDVSTSRISTSPIGTAITTNQLRNALPSGFSSAWTITPGLSFPYLTSASLNFAAPLATLASGANVFVFLPIDQRDSSQYANTPAHADSASLAAVYTIIARAIGQAENIVQLKGIKVDDAYWDDSSQTATWQGQVTDKASLGSLTALGARATLNPVVRALKQRSVVILRGQFQASGGGTGTHWMLATMYEANGDGSVASIVADDPWTGVQVRIDPTTKAVVAPAGYALSGFVVNGYQTVSIN